MMVCKVVRDGKVFKVKKRILYLFWETIGEPCSYDGGWMGPKEFKSEVAALGWIKKIGGCEEFSY